MCPVGHIYIAFIPPRSLSPSLQSEKIQAGWPDFGNGENREICWAKIDCKQFRNDFNLFPDAHVPVRHSEQWRFAYKVSTLHLMIVNNTRERKIYMCSGIVWKLYAANWISEFNCTFPHCSTKCYAKKKTCFRNVARLRMATRMQTVNKKTLTKYSRNWYLYFGIFSYQLSNQKRNVYILINKFTKNCLINIIERLRRAFRWKSKFDTQKCARVNHVIQHLYVVKISFSGHMIFHNHVSMACVCIALCILPLGSWSASPNKLLRC